MGCRKLKELPFDSNYNAEKLSITGEREWWDGLVWKHEAIRATLNPKFRHRALMPQAVEGRRVANGLTKCKTWLVGRPNLA